MYLLMIFKMTQRFNTIVYPTKINLSNSSEAMEIKNTVPSPSSPDTHITILSTVSGSDPPAEDPIKAIIGATSDEVYFNYDGGQNDVNGIKLSSGIMTVDNSNLNVFKSNQAKISIGSEALHSGALTFNSASGTDSLTVGVNNGTALTVNSNNTLNTSNNVQINSGNILSSTTSSGATPISTLNISDQVQINNGNVLSSTTDSSSSPSISTLNISGQVQVDNGAIVSYDSTNSITKAEATTGSFSFNSKNEIMTYNNGELKVGSSHGALNVLGTGNYTRLRVGKSNRWSYFAFADDSLGQYAYMKVNGGTEIQAYDSKIVFGNNISLDNGHEISSSTIIDDHTMFYEFDNGTSLEIKTNGKITTNTGWMKIETPSGSSLKFTSDGKIYINGDTHYLSIDNNGKLNYDDVPISTSDHTHDELVNGIYTFNLESDGKVVFKANDTDGASLSSTTSGSPSVSTLNISDQVQINGGNVLSSTTDSSGSTLNISGQVQINEKNVISASTPSGTNILNISDQVQINGGNVLSSTTSGSPSVSTLNISGQVQINNGTTLSSSSSTLNSNTNMRINGGSADDDNKLIIAQNSDSTYAAEFGKDQTLGHAYMRLSGGDHVFQVFDDYAQLSSTTNGESILQFHAQQNDKARIKFSENTTDSGDLEIATGNDGNEPIYVRQYSGSSGNSDFTNIQHELCLLDSNGDTVFSSTDNAKFITDSTTNPPTKKSLTELLNDKASLTEPDTFIQSKQSESAGSITEINNGIQLSAFKPLSTSSSAANSLTVSTPASFIYYTIYKDGDPNGKSKLIIGGTNSDGFTCSAITSNSFTITHSTIDISSGYNVVGYYKPFEVANKSFEVELTTTGSGDYTLNVSTGGVNYSKYYINNLNTILTARSELIIGGTNSDGYTCSSISNDSFTVSHSTTKIGSVAGWHVYGVSQYSGPLSIDNRNQYLEFFASQLNIKLNNYLKLIAEPYRSPIWLIGSTQLIEISNEKVAFHSTVKPSSMVFNPVYSAQSELTGYQWTTTNTVYGDFTTHKNSIFVANLYALYNGEVYRSHFGIGYNATFYNINDYSRYFTVANTYSLSRTGNIITATVLISSLPSGATLINTSEAIIRVLNYSSTSAASISYSTNSTGKSSIMFNSTDLMKFGSPETTLTALLNAKAGLAANNTFTGTNNFASTNDITFTDSSTSPPTTNSLTDLLNTKASLASANTFLAANTFASTDNLIFTNTSPSSITTGSLADLLSGKANLTSANTFSAANTFASTDNLIFTNTSPSSITTGSLADLLSGKASLSSNNVFAGTNDYASTDNITFTDSTTHTTTTLTALLSSSGQVQSLIQDGDTTLSVNGTTDSAAFNGTEATFGSSTNDSETLKVLGESSNLIIGNNDTARYSKLTYNYATEVVGQTTKDVSYLGISTNNADQFVQISKKEIKLIEDPNDTSNRDGSIRISPYDGINFEHVTAHPTPAYDSILKLNPYSNAEDVYCGGESIRSFVPFKLFQTTGSGQQGTFMLFGRDNVVEGEAFYFGTRLESWNEKVNPTDSSETAFSDKYIYLSPRNNNVNGGCKIAIRINKTQMLVSSTVSDLFQLISSSDYSNLIFREGRKSGAYGIVGRYKGAPANSTTTPPTAAIPAYVYISENGGPILKMFPDKAMIEYTNGNNTYQIDLMNSSGQTLISSTDDLLFGSSSSNVSLTSLLSSSGQVQSRIQNGNYIAEIVNTNDTPTKMLQITSNENTTRMTMSNSSDSANKGVIEFINSSTTDGNNNTVDTSHLDLRTDISGASAKLSINKDNTEISGNTTINGTLNVSPSSADNIINAYNGKTSGAARINVGYSNAVSAHSIFGYYSYVNDNNVTIPYVYITLEGPSNIELDVYSNKVRSTGRIEINASNEGTLIQAIGGTGNGARNIDVGHSSSQLARFGHNVDGTTEYAYMTKVGGSAEIDVYSNKVHINGSMEVFSNSTVLIGAYDGGGGGVAKVIDIGHSGSDYTRLGNFNDGSIAYSYLKKGGGSAEVRVYTNAVGIIGALETSTNITCGGGITTSGSIIIGSTDRYYLSKDSNAPYLYYESKVHGLGVMSGGLFLPKNLNYPNESRYIRFNVDDDFYAIMYFWKNTSLSQDDDEYATIRIDFHNTYTDANYSAWITHTMYVQKNQTIAHLSPVPNDNDFENIKIGEPVFANGNTYVKSGDIFVESTIDNIMDCVPGSTQSGTYKTFTGICVAKYRIGDKKIVGDFVKSEYEFKQNCIEFATHGDFLFKIPSDHEVSEYTVGDTITFEGNIIDDEISITNRTIKSTIGTVTKIFADDGYLAIFKTC